MCRSNSDVRKLLGFPEVCPHGITADNLPAPLQSPISNLRSPFTRLHRLISRLGLAPKRCGCAARATRLDAALNRLLTRLQRRFNNMRKIASLALLAISLAALPATAQTRYPLTLTVP
jgi:hypothetical protein